jgi:hypothetical protein
MQDLEMTPDTRKKIKKRQERERKILSLALLLQVSLQWTWGFVLLLSPRYSQPECSGITNLVLFFLRTYSTKDIQTSQGGTAYHLHAVYP